MDCEAVGADELVNNVVMAYPNPAKNSVFITGITPQSTITVRDTQGRLILSETCQDTQKIFDSSLWSNGVYFIELKDNSRIQQLKVQVLH
jgi:Secretion system C-terminal sorting domain